jgi:hypothetical protein
MAEYRALGGRTGSEKICEICDSLFIPWCRKQKLCSPACRNEYQSRTYRGENHWGWGKRHPHTEETKKKISENNARYWLGKKRSEETKEKFHLSHVGRYHGRELLEHVDAKIRLRKSAEMKRWARAIKKRDGRACLQCGEIEGTIIAHHIWPFSTFPDLRFDLSNGVTLCERCHLKTLGREVSMVNSFGWMTGMPIVGAQRLKAAQIEAYG